MNANNTLLFCALSDNKRRDNDDFLADEYTSLKTHLLLRHVPKLNAVDWLRWMTPDSYLYLLKKIQSEFCSFFADKEQNNKSLHYIYTLLLSEEEISNTVANLAYEHRLNITSLLTVHLSNSINVVTSADPEKQTKLTNIRRKFLNEMYDIIDRTINTQFEYYKARLMEYDENCTEYFRDYLYILSRCEQISLNFIILDEDTNVKEIIGDDHDKEITFIRDSQGKYKLKVDPESQTCIYPSAKSV